MGGGGGAGYGSMSSGILTGWGQGGMGAFGALRAEKAQEVGIKDWAEHLDQIIRDYQESFDPIWTYVDPLADPVQSGLANDILLSLGQPSGGVGMRGGPMAQVISLAGATGGDVAASLGGAVRNYKKTGRARGWGPDEDDEDALRSAVRKAGYLTLQELLEAQVQWEEDQAKFETESADTRQAVLEGRMAGFENLAQMLKDYPDPMSERGAQLEALLAEIEYNRGLEENAIMEAANMGNFNPAGALGQLSEQAMLQRETAGADAIVRALQLDQAYSEAITGLTTGLVTPQEAGIQLAQLRGNLTSAMGGQAASQASVINQINESMSTNAMLAEIGFPTEYLLGLNEANRWNAQTQSWIAGAGNAQNSMSAGSNSNTSPTQSGPATSGAGWSNDYPSYNKIDWGTWGK